MRRIWRTAIRPTERKPARCRGRQRAIERLNTPTSQFDPAQRRAAVRRTAWFVVGVVALIYAGFFVRALLLMGNTP